MNMNLRKRIFLVYHSSGLKGPINFLEDYLLKKNYEVIHIQHPLDIYRGKYTYVSNNLTTISKRKRNGNHILNLLIDFYISILAAHKYSFEVYIGGNNFDTIPAIVLRKMHIKKIKTIIYFSADFSEKRYKNSLMNFIYDQLERLAIKNADYIVSNTKRAENKRIALGLNRKKSIIIPNGVHLPNIQFSEKKIKKDTFIYIGNVTQEHGIFDFVRKIKPLIKKIVVIGQGDQWEKLQEYCNSNKITNEFFYKKTHEDTILYLEKFKGFGLAPYTTDSLWTWYSSPLKVNEYIACCVPVIISNIPEIASYIDTKKLGVVYDALDVNQIQKKLTGFDTKGFSKKAKNFYDVFSYDTLYSALPL